MQQIRQVWPSRAGLLYEVTGDGDLVVDVDIDRRRVWSFRQEAATVPPDLVPPGAAPDHLRFQPWPAALAPRLRGSFAVRLRRSGTDEGIEVTASLDESTESPRLVDVYGRPLVVNKWGRLGRAIVDAEPGMVDRMLDHMDELRVLLEKKLGPVVYVTGGTLLGPVRENGRLLPHDDDADLAYLSDRTHPADVAVESFQIGRMLREAGYDVQRLSVGHLQIQFSHDGVPDHYVDVFAGFLLDGWWLQHFPIRARVGRERLLPTSTVVVEGRAEPATLDQELMLEELFGPGWRSPDPSFVFDIASSTGDRFYGWFADYNVERESWDDIVLLGEEGSADPGIVSGFSRWVHEHSPAGAAVLDLGCGLGADAVALAGLGRHVHAVDFSRYAVDALRSRSGGSPADVDVEVLNLLDTRQVIRLGAELAATPQSWVVHGRRLLNALEDRGRANVFRLCSMILRDGGGAHFDVVADHDYPGIAAYRHLTVAQVAAEAERHGLVLEDATSHLEPFRWFGPEDEQIVTLHRMTFRRRTR